jgi:hypothetical protein
VLDARERLRNSRSVCRITEQRRRQLVRFADDALALGLELPDRDEERSVRE